MNRRHFCLKFCARAKDDTKLLQVFDLVIKFGINSQNLFIINREFTKSSGPWSSEHSLQSLAQEISGSHKSPQCIHDLCTEMKDRGEELDFFKDTFIANDYPIEIVHRIFKSYVP